MENYENIKNKIADLDIKFKVLEPIKNSMNGIETESVLLEYDGAQFVYVPGRTGVLLGWDADRCELGQNVLKAMRQYCEESNEHYAEELSDCEVQYLSDIAAAEQMGAQEKAQQLREDMEEDLAAISACIYDTFEDFMDTWKEHLKECMSPVRTVDIGPMIVEIDSRYIEERTTLDEFLQKMKKTSFTIQTEDEWEYLCNGGTRSLFRWGDSLEEELKEMFQIGCVSGEDGELLTKPNMFGLYISYNSYKLEIIDNIDYAKGGDGGCSLCGGDGLIYVLPAYTAFYRNPLPNHSLSENYYSYRRIIRLQP